MNAPALPPEKLVIAGGGPAGLSAAIYAGRAGLSPLVLEGVAMGGRLAELERIDNYPGFPEGIAAPDLALAMRAQAERFGARFRPGESLASLAPAPEGDGLLAIATDAGATLLARTAVLATGTRPRRLGVPGEDLLSGRGVSYCATCDGAFFKDRPVAVAGGGPEGLAAALYLSRLCPRVDLLFPEPAPTAPERLVSAARANDRIAFHPATAVLEVLPTDGPRRSVRALRVAPADDPAAASELPVNGIFVALGAGPASEWARGVLDLEPDGRVRIDARGAASLPGVFAAGDLVEPFLRQIATAVASGAVAATSAIRYLSAR